MNNRGFAGLAPLLWIIASGVVVLVADKVHPFLGR